jgi:hypothetical protein
MALYALDNVRQRSFIPSTQNTFQGFPVKYVMLDSGCSSLLLPFEPGQINNIAGWFPHANYEYYIRAGGGVAALQAPVLCIKRRHGVPPFNISLSQSFMPYNFTYGKPLRFTLCYEDALALVALSNPVNFPITDIGYVTSFINAVDVVRTALPATVIGERRRHALLGRAVIASGGRDVRMATVHPARTLTIVSSNPAALSITNADIVTIATNAFNAVIADPTIGHVWEDLEDDFAAEDKIFLEDTDS